MIQVIEDKFMTKEVYFYTNRTWIERLFTLPWTPRERFRLNLRVEPSDKFLLIKGQNIIVVHPEYAHKLRSMLPDNPMGLSYPFKRVFDAT